MKQQHQRIAHMAPWVLFALLIAAAPAVAQVAEEVTYTWTPPTTGSPVEYYVVQHSVNGGPYAQIATVTTNQYTLMATYGDSHVIRVAGVDAEARQGPYSVPSEAYTPSLGAPGQPGQPIPIF
jgi:hypothetical protein